MISMPHENDVEHHFHTRENITANLDACIEKNNCEITITTKDLSNDGNPKFSTVLKITKALGLKMAVKTL